eukprot:1157679-Pelagomonas_calceolata.AAC.10
MRRGSTPCGHEVLRCSSGDDFYIPNFSQQLTQLGDLNSCHTACRSNSKSGWEEGRWEVATCVLRLLHFMSLASNDSGQQPVTPKRMCGLCFLSGIMPGDITSCVLHSLVPFLCVLQIVFELWPAE